MRFFDLTVQDDQLLSQESILGDELSFASREIDHCGKCNRVASRMREVEEGLFKSWDETGEERAESVEKVGYVGRSLKELSKTIKGLY
jgi:hypothetical protein